MHFLKSTSFPSAHSQNQLLFTPNTEAIRLWFQSSLHSTNKFQLRNLHFHFLLSFKTLLSHLLRQSISKYMLSTS